MRVQNNKTLIDIILKKSIVAIDDNKYYVVFVDLENQLEIPLFGGYDSVEDEIKATYDVYNFENKYSIVLDWEFKLGMEIKTDKLVELVANRNTCNETQPIEIKLSVESSNEAEIKAQLEKLDLSKLPIYVEVLPVNSNTEELPQDDFNFVINALYKKLDFVDSERVKRNKSTENSLQKLISYLLYTWGYNVTKIKDFNKYKDEVVMMYNHAAKQDKQFDIEYISTLFKCNTDVNNELRVIRCCLLGSNKKRSALPDVTSVYSIFRKRKFVSHTQNLIKILPTIISANIDSQPRYVNQLLYKYNNESKYREFAMDILIGLVNKRKHWIDVFNKLISNFIKNPVNESLQEKDFSELSCFINLLYLTG